MPASMSVPSNAALRGETLGTGWGRNLFPGGWRGLGRFAQLPAVFVCPEPEADFRCFFDHSIGGLSSLKQDERYGSSLSEQQLFLLGWVDRLRGQIISLVAGGFRSGFSRRLVVSGRAPTNANRHTDVMQGAFARRLLAWRQNGGSANAPLSILRRLQRQRRPAGAQHESHGCHGSRRCHGKAGR